MALLQKIASHLNDLIQKVPADMSQHIINQNIADNDGAMTKMLVIMFGWDSALSRFFTQSHVESPIEDKNGDTHFEAIDDSLNEIIIPIRPSYIVSNQNIIREMIRDNAQSIVIDSGLAISTKLIDIIDLICNRMIEDATDSRFRFRIESYEI